MKSVEMSSRLGPYTGEDERIEAAFSTIRGRGGEILNIHRTASHSPGMFRAMAAYAAALRSESAIPAPIRQLVVLRVCQLNGGTYEWNVHVGVTTKMGVPVQKIEALQNWSDSDLYSNDERAALGYADQTSANRGVDEATFQAVMNAFGKQGVVDLTALVGWYVGNTRFTNALEIAQDAV
jgi:alkylhydroperoxidase family enzyme